MSDINDVNEESIETELGKNEHQLIKNDKASVAYITLTLEELDKIKEETFIEYLGTLIEELTAALEKLKVKQ